MGKRGFGQRRTVVQLGSEERKQPTYGFGYRPPPEGEAPRAEGALTALSGLMSQYAEDDDDDEIDDDGDGDVAVGDNEEVDASKPSTSAKSESNGNGGASMPLKKFVAASDSPLRNPSPGPPKTEEVTEGKEAVSVVTEKQTVASPSSSNQAVEECTDSGVKAEPKDEIDLKLRDFLAEIESIDVDMENSDGRPPDESATSTMDAATTSTASGDVEGDSKTVAPSGSKEGQKERKKRERRRSEDSEEEGRSSEEERIKSKPRPTEPQAPTTPWQHCLDDSTQCYYYWSMETNEVTWEIPAEYSQYLLRCKQYEEQLAKYETELAAWKKLQRRVKKKKHHKRSRHRDASSAEPRTSDKTEPRTLDRTEPRTSDKTEAAGQQPSNGATKILYGPQLPSADHTTSQTAEDVGVVSSGRVRVVSYDSDTVTEDGADVSFNAGNSGDLTLTKTSASGNTVSSKTSPSGSFAGMKLSVDDSSADTKTSAGGNTATKASPGGDSKERREKIEDLNENADIENHWGVGPNGKEEQELVNNGTPLAGADGDEDFDIDDIDRELDQALDRRQCKAGAGITVGDEQNVERSVTGASQHREDVTLSQDPQAYRVTEGDIKLRTSILTEISELSNDVLSRLEESGACRTDIDRLYSLLIQTQTRIQDWKAGGLNSEYLLRQLVETSAELARCQDLPPLAQRQAAVPAADLVEERDCRFLAEWDSVTERYLYVNLTTGTASWEIPPMGSSVMHGSSMVAGGAASKEELEEAACHSAVDSLPMGLSYGTDMDQCSAALPVSRTTQSSSDLESLTFPVSRDIFTLVEKTPPPPPPSPPPSGFNPHPSGFNPPPSVFSDSVEQANHEAPFRSSNSSQNESLHRADTVPFSRPPLFITQISTASASVVDDKVAPPVMLTSAVTDKDDVDSGHDAAEISGETLAGESQSGTLAGESQSGTEEFTVYETSEESRDGDEEMEKGEGEFSNEAPSDLHGRTDIGDEGGDMGGREVGGREVGGREEGDMDVRSAVEDTALVSGEDWTGAGTVDEVMGKENEDAGMDNESTGMGRGTTVDDSAGTGSNEGTVGMGKYEYEDYELDGVPLDQGVPESDGDFVLPSDGTTVTSQSNESHAVEAEAQQLTAGTSSCTADSKQQQQQGTAGKEKRKKREKHGGTELLAGGGGVSIKKKKLTGLVEKWQKVQKEVNDSIQKQQQHQQQLLQQLEKDSAKIKQDRETATAAKR